MMQVDEIKTAVAQLTLPDLIDFGQWYRRFEAEVWDQQIERDIKAGKLDRLAKEALADYQANRCIEL